jgi:hypothetical protein
VYERTEKFHNNPHWKDLLLFSNISMETMAQASELATRRVGLD